MRLGLACVWESCTLSRPHAACTYSEGLEGAIAESAAQPPRSTGLEIGNRSQAAGFAAIGAGTGLFKALTRSTRRQSTSAHLPSIRLGAWVEAQRSHTGGSGDHRLVYGRAGLGVVVTENLLAHSDFSAHDLACSGDDRWAAGAY